MEWIFNQLRERPELAIFLTIFLGFWLGKLRIGKFTLGTVTSVLLVGVLVGQLNIAVPGPIKSVFFLLFLFAVGYKVGPQFFRGLKKDGHHGQYGTGRGPTTKLRQHHSRILRRHLHFRYGRLGMGPIIHRSQDAGRAGKGESRLQGAGGEDGQLSG